MSTVGCRLILEAKGTFGDPEILRDCDRLGTASGSAELARGREWLNEAEGDKVLVNSCSAGVHEG